MKTRLWIALPFPLFLLFAQTELALTDRGWPRELDSNGRHFTVYQPQVERWRNDVLEARAVVSVTASGTPQPIYGIVSLSAHTDVNKESRTVGYWGSGWL